MLVRAALDRVDTLLAEYHSPHCMALRYVCGTPHQSRADTQEQTCSVTAGLIDNLTHNLPFAFQLAT